MDRIIDSTLAMKWILPAALMAGGVISGIIIERIVLKKLQQILDSTQWDGLAVIIRAIRGMPVLWLGAAGASGAINNIEMSGTLFVLLQKVLLVVVILSVTLVAARITTGFLSLYSKKSGGALPSISIFAHLTRVVIFFIGVMVILQSLGVSITPLITALGVGGLAVALALQDTLSNFFSGLVILASGQIRRGDYVELETGEKGYITDITWKNTTIRTIPDNMIIVPNSKLSSTITTNYYQPKKEVLVRVDVGVSYDSDLKKVERVATEVAAEVMHEVPGGVSSFEPYARYQTFGDFSINFTVIMRATEYFDQYVVKHEFIKRLHERFNKEGIVIPFPIRTVYMHDNVKENPPSLPPR